MLFDLTLAAFLMLTVFLSALMFFSRRGLSGLGIVLLLPLLLVLCFAVFGGLVPSLGVSTLGAVLSQQVLGINSTLQLSFLFSATLTAVAYLVLTLTRPRQTTTPVLLSLSVVIVASVCLLCTQHFLVIFLSFELLLLSSLLLLRLTSKSERVLEAVMEMFLWTLVGSLGLFFAFTSL